MILLHFLFGSLSLPPVRMLNGSDFNWKTIKSNAEWFVYSCFSILFDVFFQPRNEEVNVSKQTRKKFVFFPSEWKIQLRSSFIYLFFLARSSYFIFCAGFSVGPIASLYLRMNEWMSWKWEMGDSQQKHRPLKCSIYPYYASRRPTTGTETSKCWWYLRPNRIDHNRCTYSARKCRLHADRVVTLNTRRKQYKFRNSKPFRSVQSRCRLPSRVAHFSIADSGNWNPCAASRYGQMVACTEFNRFGALNAFNSWRKANSFWIIYFYFLPSSRWPRPTGFFYGRVFALISPRFAGGSVSRAADGHKWAAKEINKYICQ